MLAGRRHQFCMARALHDSRRSQTFSLLASNVSPERNAVFSPTVKKAEGAVSSPPAAS